MTDWHRYYATNSNAGRWGPNDERGTLNYISSKQVLAALQTVTRGELVSLGYDLPLDTSATPRPLTLKVMQDGLKTRGANDVVTVEPHGYDVTHLDALGHVFFEGASYNARTAASVITDSGLAFGAITAMRQGILTRGVLLDVAEARGVDSLLEGDTIAVADILKAEAITGTQVAEGDAIFIRSGIGQNRRWLNGATIARRPGVLPAVIPWLHERHIAVYSGDCIESLPEDGDKGDMPLHQIGLASMGLTMLDNPDVESLRTACKTYRRSTFALFVAPLRIRGGTGSAVNPIAVF